MKRTDYKRPGLNLTIKQFQSTIILSELIIAFNEALNLEKNDDTVYELKSKDKNAEPQKFNVLETLESVRQSAHSINIEENLNM